MTPEALETAIHHHERDLGRLYRERKYFGNGSPAALKVQGKIDAEIFEIKKEVTRLTKKLEAK